jgi:RimJ/RimL family protein N-acetyltransferase
MQLTAQTMTGRFVRLEPLTPAHKDDLRRTLDCDPETWALLSLNGQDDFESWWTEATDQMAAGTRIPFAVRNLASGEVIGTTSFLSFRPEHRGVEIGWTFYRPDARAGATNPECKLLLLQAAFEAGASRVEFSVDARNARSQAAVLKLGAVREGVLRRHKITWTGYARDTVVFSILAEEWPAVRRGLESRLAAAAA